MSQLPSSPAPDEISPSGTNDAPKTPASKALAPTMAAHAAPAVELRVDEERAQSLATTINVRSPVTIADFGRDLGRATVSYSSELLDKARSKDLGEMGDQLNEIVYAAEKFDLTDFDDKWTRMPVFGPVFEALFKSRAKMLNRFASLETQVDGLVGNIENTQVRLTKRAQKLDEMYENVRQEALDLAVYARASEIRVGQLDDEIATLRQAEQSASTAEELSLLEASRASLSKRAGDFSVLHHSAIQTLPMIRMVQANNLMLVEKFRTIETLTLPAWRRSFMMALALDEQNRAVKLANEIDDTTNEFMKKNADLLHENSVATARANQRLVVDVETLRHVHNKVLQTLTDVRQANAEGEKQRTEALSQLEALRDEMRSSLITYEPEDDDQPS